MAQTRQTATGSHTVLVADASPTVLRVAEGVLAEAGFRPVCTGKGGESLLRRARKAKPSLILLARDLEEPTGYATCRALGQDPRLDKIPIVIMNNRGRPTHALWQRELGVVDHINKPFAPEVLLAVVKHSLDRTGTSNRRRRATTEEVAAEELLVDDTPVARLAAALAAGIEDPPSPKLFAHICNCLEMPQNLNDLFELWAGHPGGAALAGDLAAVPIAEVLQLLSLQRQSGFLEVRQANVLISIALKSGAVRLVTGENIPKELLLGSILVRERIMEQRELDLLLKNRRGARQRLGNQMVKLGYLSRDQLHEALRHQSAELVYELLRWQDGRFVFQRRSELPASVLEFEFGLGIDELLMEGFRRVDEWGLIEEAIPSFDVVLVPEPGGAEHTGPQGLNDEEREVLAHVDGETTVQEIINRVGWGTFGVARVLYRLVSARVVAVRGAHDIVIDGA